MHQLLKVISVSSLTLLVGCSTIQNSFPTNDLYKSSLGNRFETKKELTANLINTDDSSNNGVYIKLTPKPGIDNPNVRFKDTIPAGLLFEVTGVKIIPTQLKYIKNFEYIVKPENTDMYSDYTYRINVTEYLGSENKGLDDTLYSYIGKKAIATTELTPLAIDLKNTILNKDKESFESYFKEIDLLPSTSEYETYFQEDLLNLLANHKTEHTIFTKDNRAVILYYRSDLVEEPKYLDWNNIGNNWLTIYAAIELEKVNDKWMFHYTPFYFFRHVPWAGDYG